MYACQRVRLPTHVCVLLLIRSLVHPLFSPSVSISLSIFTFPLINLSPASVYQKTTINKLHFALFPVSGIDGVDQWETISNNLPSKRTEFVYSINQVSGRAAIR